jgi:hypothetical protein
MSTNPCSGRFADETVAGTPLPVSSRRSKRSPVPSAGRSSTSALRLLSCVRTPAVLDLPRANYRETAGQIPAPNPARRPSEGDPDRDPGCRSCDPVRAKSVETSSGSYPLRSYTSETSAVETKGGRSNSTRDLCELPCAREGTRRVLFNAVGVPIQDDLYAVDDYKPHPESILIVNAPRGAFWPVYVVFWVGSATESRVRTGILWRLAGQYQCVRCQ